MSNVINIGGQDYEIPDLKKVAGKGLGGLRWVFLAIIAGILIFSSVYTVRPEEVGIVLRLGKYLGRENDAGPGLHFKIPLIDTVYKVPVERQLKAEFGFRTEEAGVQSRFRDVAEESSMLTGDKNAAVVEFVVQYRIIDAYRYLFRVRNIDATFRDMSEALMRKAVGDRTVSEVVTVGRMEIEQLVEQELQELCDQYETGIRVDQVVLQNSAPPEPVMESFNDVNQAEQDRDRRINQAQQQYNQVVPRAEGEARKTIEQAEGYALDRVNRSQGDAARFSALYGEYRKAPEVTRKRIYLETMGRILPRVGGKVIIDEDVEGMVPLIDLGKSLAPAAAQAARRPEGGGS